MGNLMHAGRALATDLLPTIVFAILLALHVDVRVATAVSVAISIDRRVKALLSLGLTHRSGS